MNFLFKAGVVGLACYVYVRISSKGKSTLKACLNFGDKLVPVTTQSILAVYLDLEISIIGNDLRFQQSTKRHTPQELSNFLSSCYINILKCSLLNDKCLSLL